MSTFNLTVVTPDRQLLNEHVNGVTVRTTSGDVGILSGHSKYVAPLSIGAMIVTSDGKTKRVAAIAGGLIKVDENGTTILTNTCEWADEIDIDRARKAKERAQQYLDSPTDLHTIDVATLKLRRALNRISIKEDM